MPRKENFHNFGRANLKKIVLDRQTLCQPREEGGLRNWKTKIMNEAMIVKQVWRIVQNPNTLMARTFKAKYFPKLDISFFSCKSSAFASWIWRSIS